MPTFSALTQRLDTAIRKGLEGAVFVKRFDAADTAIATLKDATGLLALPTGYLDVGRLTKDQGVQWTRSVDNSEVESLGAAEPTRIDTVTDTTGLQFTAQESKKAVFQLYDGIDLTTKIQAANGNVTWDKPDRPASIYYRVFVLFKDGDGVDAVYFAKWLPRAMITERGEQSWNENDELQYPITMSAFVDPVFGTSMRTLWAGPVATLTAMGFAAS